MTWGLLQDITDTAIIRPYLIMLGCAYGSLAGLALIAIGLGLMAKSMFGGRR